MIFTSKNSLSLMPTLPDNLRDSRFWTVSPGLKITVRNLLHNQQRLPFLHFCRLDFPKILKISTILHCLSYFNVNTEYFLINHMVNAIVT